MCILHKCDNRGCVNPKHLFIGTNADNAKDKVEKGRQAKGEGNGRSKLTQKKVNQIRELYASGNYTYTDLANIFAVCNNSIIKIIKNEHWKLPCSE